jgi:homoserine O-succinyltransferase
MPILLDGIPPAASALPWIGAEAGLGSGGAMAVDADLIEIGLVNNMPDGALQATERQFIDILAAAAGSRVVRLHRFALPEIERGEMARAHMAGRYADFSTMGQVPLDGLIVTGCEPRAASLADEPYWPSFTRLVDWAESNTVSTLWSCLAAHAAVLHLDGIRRRPMPRKRAGVYDCAPVAAHRLLEGVTAPMQVSHSRWNDLDEADLTAHGYHVLTRSAIAGVDLFVKPWNSLFVFFQGHPEYDPESIGREYRRDVARYLRGERSDYPSMPHRYFDAATEAALEAVRAAALIDRSSMSLLDLPRQLPLRDGLAASWRDTTGPVFRNWIDVIAAGRSAPDALS